MAPKRLTPDTTIYPNFVLSMKYNLLLRLVNHIPKRCYPRNGLCYNSKARFFSYAKRLEKCLLKPFEIRELKTKTYNPRAKWQKQIWARYHIPVLRLHFLRLFLMYIQHCLLTKN